MLRRTFVAKVPSRVVRCFSDASSPLSLEHLTGDQEGIAVISFSNPQQRNSLGKPTLALLQSHVQYLNESKSVRCVIVRSTVPKIFCAGADLKERAAMPENEVAGTVNNLRFSLGLLATIKVPTIAAINGAALGGGMEAALCCDLRVASSLAKLGLPETGLAIIPGAGGTQRLPRLIGISKAKELIFTGSRLDCYEAHDIGMVNYAVEASEGGADSSIDAAYEKAKSVAATIIKKGPVALKAAKMSIDLGCQSDLASGLKVEELCYAQCIPTEDRREGLDAFLTKRAPDYNGC